MSTRCELQSGQPTPVRERESKQCDVELAANYSKLDGQLSTKSRRLLCKNTLELNTCCFKNALLWLQV